MRGWLRQFWRGNGDTARRPVGAASLLAITREGAAVL